MPATKYHIDIDSYIGYPISKGYVRSKLASAGSGPVSVRINSYGGDVQTALDIRQQFIDHGNVTAYIFGMTASAATIIAMGAKKICMSKYALMLVHQCSNHIDNFGWFNKDEMSELLEKIRKEQTDLDTLDNVVANLYADRAGTKDVASMAKVMSEAKWLNAEECKALGLIDEIVEEDDTQQPQVTAQLKEHFVACGLPMPPMTANDELIDTATEAMPSQEENQENKTFFAAFIACIKKTLNSEKTKNVNGKQTMSEIKTIAPANICAVLGVNELSVCEDGSVTFDAEQINSMNTELKEANEERTTLNARIAELEEEVKNLKNADGAKETHVDITTEEEPIAGAEAAEFFKKFNDII